jgi:hypothetical protein
VLLRLSADGKLSNFNSLNLLYLVQSTLALCREQELARDPRHDLVFLCWSYSKDIEAIRHHLDPQELHGQFFSTTFFQNMSVEEQRGCSLVLLGQEFAMSSSSSPQTPDQHPPQATTTPSPNNISRGGDETLPVPRLNPDWTHQRASSAPDIAHSAEPQPQNHGLTPPAPQRPRPQSMLSIAGPSYDIHDLQNASKPRIVQSRSTPSLAAKFSKPVARKPLPKLNTNFAVGRPVSGTEQLLAVFRGGGPEKAEEGIWNPPEEVVESVGPSTSLKRVSTHVKSVFPLMQPDHFPCVEGPDVPAEIPKESHGSERRPDAPSTRIEANTPSSKPEETFLRVPKIRTESPAPTPPQSNPASAEPRQASSIYDFPLTEDAPFISQVRRTTTPQHPQSMAILPSNTPNIPHQMPSRKPVPSNTLTRSNALYRPHAPSKLHRYSAPPQSASPASASNGPLLAYITSALNASLADLDSPVPRGLTPTTTRSAHNSPSLQKSEQFRNCYQFTSNPNANSKAGLRHTFHLRLDTLPKMNLYGYEEFAHGPYSASAPSSAASESVFNWEAGAGARMASGTQERIEGDFDGGVREEWEQGGFSYTTTPVSALQPEWPGVDLASFGGGLQSRGMEGWQRHEVY